MSRPKNRTIIHLGLKMQTAAHLTNDMELFQWIRQNLDVPALYDMVDDMIIQMQFPILMAKICPVDSKGRGNPAAPKTETSYDCRLSFSYF